MLSMIHVRRIRTITVNAIKPALFRVFPELLDPKRKITISAQSELHVSSAHLRFRSGRHGTRIGTNY